MDSSKDLLNVALTLFLLANPLGSSPAILALVKDFPYLEQRRILFREAIFSLLIVLFFQFFGDLFFSLLNIQQYSLSLCGGFLLFLVALNMIFSKKPDTVSTTPAREPYIVPIATPLITGPGVLAIVMLFSKSIGPFTLSLAIILAWVGVTIVLVSAPFVQKVIKRRGMVALEQLMGMTLGILAMQLIVSGAETFAKSINSVKA